MSQKAWMNVYTKGSKAMQDRLAKVHANNPEFQDFIKKHGFGGNLSVKQSGLQKKPSVATVKPVDNPNPERGNLSREAMIKAAAEKIRNRKLAAGNRAAFGGELGGSFAMPGASFRTYREEVSYKDGVLKMKRGGWIALRNGKQIGTTAPTSDQAKHFIDATRESLGKKVMRAISLKARRQYAESKENRARVASYDSAVVNKLPRLTADRKQKVIRKIIAHISNPKFSTVSKRYLNAALQLGESDMSSEKALNELKKTTLASYLSKAGGRVRSATKIAIDFENDAHKDLKTVNHHSPYNVNGATKDPEVLAKATNRMKVNTDLANMFKRDAYNRIKGIALAGKKLAKEEAEQLDERNTESHPELWNTHQLVHKSGKVLKKGDIVKSDDEHYKVAGFEMPHHSGSTGRVYVHKVNAKGRKIPGSGYGMDGKEPQSFFPSVIDAKIQKKAVKEEAEEINEISIKKASKAAEKAHKEFQQAAKDKNWVKAAKRVRQANKFGDYTVPKSGWSHEEEVQHEGRSQIQELAFNIYKGKRAVIVDEKKVADEPVIQEQTPEVVSEQPKELTATEKYRMIREAKVRKGK